VDVALGVLLALTAGALCATAIVLSRVARSTRPALAAAAPAAVAPTSAAPSVAVAARPTPTSSRPTPAAPSSAPGHSDKRSKPAVVSTLEATPPDQLERFADVGGLDAIKQELRDVITLLVDPQEFAAQYRIGWNGVLLHGAPGVGKTLLARACAGELGLAFVYVSTADAVSKWIGEAPSKIDDAFRFAADHVPCILFFDEFDSLASDRGDEHHLEYRRLTNQLLESLEEYRGVRGLVVMAATNAYDCLDPAVVRAGRFDRHIEIPMPDLDARVAILQVHLNGRPVADDVNP
jgi:ATP-dependent 26S proteasome regulatory subunit